jgi:uncharacterized protein (UPF0261 family)
MAEGLIAILKDLYSKDNLDGIFALGGTMGTSLALQVLRNFPVGVPKLILSSVAFSSLIPADAMAGDLMMMQWVAGLKGINSINIPVLDSAAGAIIGAAEHFDKKKINAKKRPIVGITSHGAVPSKFLAWLQPALRDRGYEVAVFHAVGGGRSLERFIEEGAVDAVLDLMLAEVANEVAGGMTSAGKHRLEAAGKMGIPQIVAPTVDSIMWATGEPVPEKFKNRPMREHNRLISNIPTSLEEKVAAAEFIARKLNKAKGPTAVIIPMKKTRRTGSDSHAGFDDPEGREALRRVLKIKLKPEIRIMEVDTHINDPAFTDRLLQLFDEMMEKPI